MRKNKKAYSVIIALLMVWFLLVLVVWIFNLVLKELKDNRWMWNYYKAFYWAEAGQELALLDIKEKWYGINKKVDLLSDENNESIVLAKDITNFNKANDVLISYDLTNIITSNYSWSLENLQYDIIPLFSINSSSWEQKVTNISLNITSSTPGDLVWNIVSNNSWISWTWSFDSSNISSFLIDTSNSNNYLIITNAWNDILNYTLTSWNSEYFSKPRGLITSSAKIWSYKQNLSTFIDNTDYLWFLKYSIYSE